MQRTPKGADDKDSGGLWEDPYNRLQEVVLSGLKLSWVFSQQFLSATVMIVSSRLSHKALEPFFFCLQLHLLFIVTFMSFVQGHQGLTVHCSFSPRETGSSLVPAFPDGPGDLGQAVLTPTHQGHHL